MDESGFRAASDYVNALLSITAGPGKGLSGIITSYNDVTGVAAVSFEHVASLPGVKGSLDNGYAVAGPSGYILSQYKITTVATATQYTGASLTLTLTPLLAKVFSLHKPCDTASYATGILGNRYCGALAAAVPTPVSIEWASGSWCSAAGGRGWGATGPCVSNGLVVTTSANKFVYGLSPDGNVKFKFMTGKRVHSPARCVTNADKTVTIYAGSADHFVYRLTTDAARVLRGSSWYSE